MVLTELFGGVFVGDIDAAKDLDLLRARNITNILVTATGLEHFHEGQPNLVYCHVDILDDSRDELLPKLPKCFKFLRQATKKGQNVLVHCLAGSQLHILANSNIYQIKQYL